MSSSSSLSANDASRGPVGCTSNPLLRSSSLNCSHAVRHSSTGHATCTRWLPRRIRRSSGSTPSASLRTARLKSREPGVNSRVPSSSSSLKNSTSWMACRNSRWPFSGHGVLTALKKRPLVSNGWAVNCLPELVALAGAPLRVLIARADHGDERRGAFDAALDRHLPVLAGAELSRCPARPRCPGRAGATPRPGARRRTPAPNACRPRGRSSGTRSVQTRERTLPSADTVTFACARDRILSGVWRNGRDGEAQR